MNIGFRMQIYPNEIQEKQLLEWCKISHNMWNFLVSKYKDSLPVVNKYGIKNYNPDDLIKDVNAENVPKRLALGVIKKYSYATQRVYKKLANPPKFHKYNPNKQSFYLASTSWKFEDYKIVFPGVGRGKHIRGGFIYLDKEYICKNNIKEIIEPYFTYYKGKWYLSGCYKSESVPKSQTKKFVGLDWGIKSFMTTSDGEFVNYPKSVLREYQRIKRLQSIKDKKVQGSNNYYKIMHKISKAYERLENLKKSFIEQKTTELCRNNNVAIENINYQEISHKKNSKFIRRQNTVAPYERFIDKLQWKCDKFGSYLIRVEPNYTSQICCVCGQLHKLTLKDRNMKCDCGNNIDRDVNAAINIKNRAEAVLSSNIYLL